MITLQAEPRQVGAKLHKMRQEGKIPAVYYGRLEASTPILVSKVEFEKVFKQTGESSVINLTTPTGAHDALVHDLDRDPVTGIIRHIDFYVIEKGKKVSVHVPIEFVGVSGAIKDLGGVLVKVLHEVEIEAEASKLPHHIEVDISSLVDFESQILAGDLKLPAGVTLITGPEEVIVLANEAKEEVIEEVPMDISQIELSEKKGKKEEEGVEGEEPKAKTE